MEVLFGVLMFLAYITGDTGIRDRMTHPCDKPYVCQNSKAGTKACLKEAMDYQMENCLAK